MKIESNCPVCGANSFKKVFEAPYFRGDNEKFSIQECESCKLWITNPRPEDDDLGLYYETENYVSHTDSSKSLIDKVYQLVKSFAVKSKVSLINKHSPTKGKLLDYGAGTGFFLDAAQKAGWEVQGIEPSAEARKNASQKGISLSDPSEFEWRDADINCITLWHVLEHLPDLKDHMLKFKNTLVKGGVLIIAVPNHESVDSKKYKDSWAALDVPLHLYHFKKSNIKDLAGQFGFELISIRNMPFDSFYVSMLSEKIKKGKVNYFSAFWAGLISNIKAMHNKNASSLIYILKKS